jgi:hypothetical protein
MAEDATTPVPPSASIRFRTTFEELLDGVRIANAAQQRVTDGIVLLVLLAGLVGWSVGFASVWAGSLAVVAAGYLLLERIPPLRFLWPVLSRGPGVRPYLTNDTVVSMDASGVHRVIGSRQRDIAWSALSAVHEDARCIHLVEGTGARARWVLTIPKRSLSDAQLHALRAALGSVSSAEGVTRG